MIQVTESHNPTYTFERCAAKATLNVMTPHQVANKKPVPHVQLLLTVFLLSASNFWVSFSENMQKSMKNDGTQVEKRGMNRPQCT